MGNSSVNPLNLGASTVIVLAASNAQQSVSGAAETNLAKVTVHGGVFGANDTLRITARWRRNSGGTANTQAIIRIGGATVSAGTIILNNSIATSATDYECQRNVYANNSVSAQKFENNQREESYEVEHTQAMETAAIDTTSDWDIWFNGVATNGADTQYLESYIIELIKAV